MAEALQLQDLVARLAASRKIAADDVLALRRDIFPDGVVSQQEAEAVFQLDQDCAVKDASWTQFYVDALTDYYLWQSEPRGYVSEAQAAELVDHIACDGRIATTSELELLINIVHWATACPPDLALLALGAIRESVLAPATASFGSNRPPAVITPADVHLIRRVVYAPGSPGGLTVTREEADLLFDLKDASSREENCDAWGDLFVKVVTSHLIFPRPAPTVPGAEEALRREAWLKQRRGVGDLLASIGKAFAKADIPLGEAWRELDLFGKEEEVKLRVEEEERLRKAMTLEAVDRDEAAWLLKRLGGRPELDALERCLLLFIRSNASAVDASLDSLMKKAEG